MGHRRARLTPFGRYLLVTRILQEGWSVSAAAESLGVSRSTAHKWLRRFREEGLEGLEGRSSAPHRRPHALSEREVDRICRARRRLKVGPHRLGPELGHPRSTVYAVLRRRGLSRLSHLDRPTGVPVRYEREHPGELLHIDVKKLGRPVEGGGSSGKAASPTRGKVAVQAMTTCTSRSTITPVTRSSRSTPTNEAIPARASCCGPLFIWPILGCGLSGS